MTPLVIIAPTDPQLAYIRKLCAEQGWQYPDAIASKDGSLTRCAPAPTGPRTTPTRHDEHLHHVCRGCGFDWITDVLA
jgi:hypothetical protein